MSGGPGGRCVHQDWDVETAHVLLVALAALPGPLLRVSGHPGGEGSQIEEGKVRFCLILLAERQRREK